MQNANISKSGSPLLFPFVDTPDKSQHWKQLEDQGLLSLISAFNLAAALNAVHKLGIAKKIYSGGFAFEGIENTHLYTNLLNYLKIHKIVSNDNGKWASVVDRRELFSDIAGAQLGFYIEAYGNVALAIPSLMDGSKDYGKDVLRDGKALGEHCATLFQSFHTPIILDILSGYKLNSIVDLGCGSGQSLMDIVANNSEIYGHGIDISKPAIQHALDIRSKNSLFEKKLDFTVADAFLPETWPSSAQSADAILAAGVVHEHFRDGEEAVINLLNSFVERFDKGLKILIIGEPELYYDLKHNDPDLYFVHIFTKQGFPRTRQEWIDLFEKTKLKLLKVVFREDAGPRFNFFVLCKR